MGTKANLSGPRRQALSFPLVGEHSSPIGTSRFSFLTQIMLDVQQRVPEGKTLDRTLFGRRRQRLS